MSGTVPVPNSTVVVYTLDQYGEVTADGDGNWVAEFPADIGTTGGAEQFDTDGDSTVYDWEVAEPMTLNELLADMVDDGRIPTEGLATSIGMQASKAPLKALSSHSADLVRHGVISARDNGADSCGNRRLDLRPEVILNGR